MPRPSVEAKRREQILAAVCDVVAEIGYRSLRVTDVAQRAGTSTGTVHYYFDTKRELMRAAFEWNFGRSLERRGNLLPGQGNPTARLRRFVESYLPKDAETIKAWRVWEELWVEAMHDTELQEVNESVYGEWRRIVAGIIRDGQDAGEFRDGDPVMLANALIGVIDGLSLQVLLRSKNMTVERMRMTCEQVVDGLVVTGTA